MLVWRLRRMILRWEKGIEGLGEAERRIYVVFWRVQDGCLWRGICVLVLDERVPVMVLLGRVTVLGQTALGEEVPIY